MEILIWRHRLKYSKEIMRIHIVLHYGHLGDHQQLPTILKLQTQAKTRLWNTHFISYFTERLCSQHVTDDIVLAIFQEMAIAEFCACQLADIN